MEQPGAALAVSGAGPRHGPRYGRVIPTTRLIQRLHQLHRYAEVSPSHEGQRPAGHRAL
jgi:hypothetical protein